MQANNPNNTIHYQRALGDIHVKSADCRNATKCGLEVNFDFLGILAESKGVHHLIPTCRFVNLANNPFSFILHPPCELQDFMDLASEGNSMYIKQHTPEWHECCDSACVTGSTLRKAIGLDTLKEQKNYYEEKFKEKKVKKDEELEKILQYGLENEVILLCVSHDYVPFH